MVLILTFATPEERDKFELIYERYKNLALHKAYQILGDYSLAEDAASEAFLRVYKNLHKIEDPASGRCAAFLVTVVKNVALTMLSRERRAPVAFEEESEEDRPDGFDLEGHVLSQLTSEDIYATLEQLTEELRSAFLLKFAYDMSHREIAGALGITENNVTVRIHRAKKKLGAILEKGGYAG